MVRRNVSVLLFATLCMWAVRVQPAEFTADDEIAAGKFLIASNYYMSDPRFQASVVLLVRHDPEKGTLGLILNHPTKMNVHEALPGISAPQHAASTLYIGGPVSPQDTMMLVRTNDPADGLLRVMNSISFSADIDSISEWLSRESQSNRIRIFAGYSGWGQGQLAAEIRMHGWKLLPADAKAVFDIDPENLWTELARRKPGVRTSIHNEWPRLDPWMPRGGRAPGRLPAQHPSARAIPAGRNADPSDSSRTAGR